MLSTTQFLEREDGRETTIVFLKNWNSEESVNKKSDYFREFIFKHVYEKVQDKKNRTYEIIKVKEKGAGIECEMQLKPRRFEEAAPFILKIQMNNQQSKVKSLPFFSPSSSSSSGKTVRFKDEEIFRLEL